jgi:ADP-heptose:LPS heptosyltransferase
LENLLPLLRMDTFEFYSFQRGPERMQLERIKSPVHDSALHSPSIIDTAGDLINMALVISVDTFAAHLAAALNRPVWLLLPFASDWRWLLKRRDSPWYPTMRLFRQPAAGKWKPVIAEVVAELTSVGLRARTTELFC